MPNHTIEYLPLESEVGCHQDSGEGSLKNPTPEFFPLTEGDLKGAYKGSMGSSKEVFQWIVFLQEPQLSALMRSLEGSLIFFLVLCYIMFLVDFISCNKHLLSFVASGVALSLPVLPQAEPDL